MSERANRKRCAASLSKRIARLKELEADQAELLGALELAHTTLCEEPKKLTSCDLLIEFAPINNLVDKAHCGECGAVAVGWNDRWRFCPFCGSQVQEATREANPYERHARESVETILRGSNLHVGRT